MKKTILLLPLMILGGFCLKALAQSTMAERQFCADPARYQYRLTDIKNLYGQDMHYDYDAANCLVKESVYESENDLAGETLYTYDERHYLIKMEIREYPRGGGDPIVSYRHIYTRDDQGYIVKYTRFRRRALTPDDLELIEDVEGTYFYDEQHRPIRAEYNFWDEQAGDWYKGKTCELAYNGKGLLEKVTMMADGSTLETERLTYNAQGKITRLTLSVPGNNDVTEVYTYDGHGDIIKAGRKDFMFEYEYDQDMLAEKTFIPRHTVRDLTYFGKRNCAVFAGLPENDSFTHAVASMKLPTPDDEGEEGEEESEKTTMKYEKIETTGVNNVATQADAQAAKVEIKAGQLILNVGGELVGKPWQLFTTSGQLLQCGSAVKATTTLDIAPLTPGTYVIRLGRVAFTFTK